MKNAEKNTPALSFETALTALENLVTQIEQGETPLAELLEAYEKGTTYLKICQTHLQNAEFKLLKINQKNEPAMPFNLASDT